MKTALLSFLLLFPSLAIAAGPSIEGLIHLLIYIIVLGLIFWLLIWFLGWVALPEPFAKIAKVIIGVIMFIMLLYLLLGIVGPFPGRW